MTRRAARDGLCGRLADDARRLGQAFARTTRDIVAAPARWRGRQWAWLGVFVAATLVAYVDKRPIQDHLQGRGGPGAHALASFADVAGSGLAVTSLGLAVFVTGQCARRRALVDAAIALGVAGIWCFVLLRAGQFVLAERRPSEGGAMRLFALDGHGVSGHAAAAALLLSPVRDVLARGATPRTRRLLTVAMLLWAAVVGWSRVWLGMHFVWNVMLGLALGFFTGSIGSRSSSAG